MTHPLAPVHRARRHRTAATLLALAACLGAGSAARSATQSPPPPGVDKSPKTRALEAGAKLLQRNAPLGPMDVYLVGFHPMKEHPGQQMEAHHYCHQVNQDFAQCVLFDGNGREARLNGIEYIISEKLFDTLPEAERAYWHPHNAEILSGQLIAPGIPQVAEKALMKDKMNSYGKTWHVWNTGGPGRPGDALPLGPAMLAWSFNRDGEADPALVQQRDERLGVSTPDRRRDRADLRPLARPQSGVDDLKGAFPKATPIPGVVDRRAATGH
ncbi:MAG: OBAP family protein [Rhizobacter sp.]|nr:OBAP family protein [Rhizobacter sp.]